LYQPKWLGDATKLRRVVDAVISAAPKWSINERIRLSVSLIHARLPDDAEKVTPNPDEKLLVRRHFLTK
jgi:hypothetical protein